MSKPKQSQSNELYERYEELDRLEELLEDMMELGVSSIADVEARMLLLNKRIDELESTIEAP